MKNLSILCLNCFGSPISLNWRVRFKLIADEIERLNPDLVVFQEVITPDHLKVLRNKLEKFGWKFYFSRNKLFISGGLVTISKNLELKNVKFHKFDEQGPLTPLSLTDRILGKGFQAVECLINGKKCLLINTHLLCLYSKRKRDFISQKKQLDQLSNFINTQKAEKIVLCGDLNNDPYSSTILDFKNKHNLIDTLNNNEITVDNNNLNRKGLLRLFSNGKPYRTDYILVSKSININKSNVVFKESKIVKDKSSHLSDHYGVLSEINL